MATSPPLSKRSKLSVDIKVTAEPDSEAHDLVTTRDEGILSAFELLPNELLWKVFEYAPDAVLPLWKVLSLISEKYYLAIVLIAKLSRLAIRGLNEERVDLNSIRLLLFTISTLKHSRPARRSKPELRISRFSERPLQLSTLWTSTYLHPALPWRYLLMEPSPYIIHYSSCVAKFIRLPQDIYDGSASSLPVMEREKRFPVFIE